MDKKLVDETAVYEIRIKGILDTRRSRWFEGMTITTDPNRRDTHSPPFRRDN